MNPRFYGWLGSVWHRLSTRGFQLWIKTALSSEELIHTYSYYFHTDLWSAVLHCKLQTKIVNLCMLVSYLWCIGNISQTNKRTEQFQGLESAVRQLYNQIPSARPKCKLASFPPPIAMGHVETTWPSEVRHGDLLWHQVLVNSGIWTHVAWQMLQHGKGTT